MIGFVGWFRPWHGLEMLIDAFHRAELGWKGAKLLLIGDGPATPALRKQVAALGLEECVVFAGAVPHDAIPEYLALVDIAAQPAANAYCCPMKVIEYMAMAKPIVVTFAIISAVNKWNDYLWPLIVTNTNEMRPLTVGLTFLFDNEGNNE